MTSKKQNIYCETILIFRLVYPLNQKYYTDIRILIYISIPYYIIIRYMTYPDIIYPYLDVFK